MLWLMSLMYNQNINGPSTEACGTPDFKYNLFLCVPVINYNLRSVELGNHD